MVEARGVEPLSENPRTQASPSAVCVLTFPPARPRRQGRAFSSFIKSRRSQSLERLVPCLNDAGDPRRRKPGADVRGLGRESYVIVVVSSFKFPLLRRSRAAARFSNPPDPRRNQIRPLIACQTDVVQSASRRRPACSFIERSMSRSASRRAMSSRLSYSFLPRHSPSSIFIRPFLR